MRPDLLALTIDDLITLSNRGLVKRAQQELQSPDLTGEIVEDDAGNITANWSDEICCKLPAKTTLAQSQCSCPATNLCRHLLRSVLFYQSQSAVIPAPTSTIISRIEPSLPQIVEWNPATIGDETLQKHYSKATLTKLRSQFDAGQVIGVHCGTKPTAHLHSLSLNLRFLVPDDIRYIHCDCDEGAPCSHVPLAVWAFRQLPADRRHGLISTELQPLSVPTALLDELEIHLLELADVGLIGINQVLRDRLARLEQRCRSDGLIWIAEIVVDLLQAHDYYQQHDAQFDIDRVINYLAEIFIRSDAIRHHDRVQNPVPLLFVRGSAQDTIVALGSSRLVGLGCGAMLQSAGATLTAYLQDVDSGTVVAMSRYFANPDDNLDPKPCWQLAQHSMSKGIQLGEIGSGQILIKGGKRTPSYQLIPGRSPMSLNPQSYQWEKLRSPLLVDDFGELIDRLQELPPRELRPRRITEQLQVLAISEVRSIDFDPVTQTVRSIVADKLGRQAEIVHPYTHRSRFGVESMLSQLQQPDTLKFISAQVSLDARSLVLAPMALVFETGGARQMLQPWIASPQTIHETQIIGDLAGADPIVDNSPIANYRRELTTALQELWLVGLDRADSRHLQQWQRLAQQGTQIGFDRFVRPIDRFAQALAQKFNTLDWDKRVAREALAIATVLSQLAR
ncbi:hypothetical protein [Chamaesiphon minutus]|uniref:SWIM-type domain-containing protein n=1 Tax=Chamaesiphon minutus (strain ATCC 27169 / PCC 6605) TaxID=1173020 RepID=K9UG12_CHAP6|nr:hypothetical protein [Chamaesiphon minutus]AFY93341.1 hypothetical protein Cha6605_2261 [Chamaesiphon minutus PCC 6605]